MELHVCYVSFLLVNILLIVRNSTEEQYEGTIDERFEKCKGNTYSEWEGRSDLFCPRFNETLSHTYCDNFIFDSYFTDILCACYAKTKWQLTETNISNVFMEYLNVNGTGLLIHSDSYNNSSQISFTETSGILRELPKNLCDFPGLLTINVSHNKMASCKVWNGMESWNGIVEWNGMVFLEWNMK